MTDVTGPAGDKPRKAKGGPVTKENRRLIAGTILGALAAAFALLNLDEVEVNWLVGSGETPLIVVIAVAFALGAAAGSIIGRRRPSRRRSPPSPGA